MCVNENAHQRYPYKTFHSCWALLHSGYIWCSLNLLALRKGTGCLQFRGRIEAADQKKTEAGMYEVISYV